MTVMGSAYDRMIVRQERKELDGINEECYACIKAIAQAIENEILNQK